MYFFHFFSSSGTLVMLLQARREHPIEPQSFFVGGHIICIFCTCIFVRTNGHVNTKRGGSTQLSLNQFFSLVLSFYVSTKSLLQSPKFSLNISFKIQLQNLDQPSPGSNNQCHRPSQQWVTTLISQSHISQVLAHSFAIFPCSLVFEIIY